MIVYKSLEELEDKLSKIIKYTDNQKVKSIIPYRYLANYYSSNFN
jgi:hypothetical protein